jgi:hypothetical protein
LIIRRGLFGNVDILAGIVLVILIIRRGLFGNFDYSAGIVW